MIDNVILLSSEITKGMKSYGPLGFLPVENKKVYKPLIIKQIENIKQIYGTNTKIYVVIGFEQEKFIKLIEKYYPNMVDHNIYIVNHNEYEYTNNGYAAYVALSIIPIGNTILLQNGILTTYTPKQFDKSILPTLKYKNDLFNIGLTKNKDRVEYIFYDLQCTWSEILYITRTDLIKIKNILANNSKIEEKFFFELINMIIEHDIILTTENIKTKEITKLSNKKNYI